ncbi:hypothetical protein [Acanthopleuribacter pedis]|uniref:Uncharacterized protein n=1 Tax=Acanthopleuribacter pedis TaxID=442870 RepID=A0A8J7U5E5_9BACT|nr:hypothetical protein [Acanthopleuribacter pedis]MBO1321647.1 hypothetical protein [Acanthopleuribacter pedis]
MDQLDLRGKFREAQDIFESQDLEAGDLRLFAWPDERNAEAGAPWVQMVAFVCRKTGGAVVFKGDVPRWVVRFSDIDWGNPF